MSSAFWVKGFVFNNYLKMCVPMRFLESFCYHAIVHLNVNKAVACLCDINCIALECKNHSQA